MSQSHSARSRLGRELDRRSRHAASTIHLRREDVMNADEPSWSVRRSAWEICGRARRPHLLDLDLLLLGLLHAVEIGAVRQAWGARLEVADHAPVQAARMFAALQLKASREPIASASGQRLEVLLPQLPECWRHALEERLAKAAAIQPVDGPREPTRDSPRGPWRDRSAMPFG